MNIDIEKITHNVSYNRAVSLTLIIVFTLLAYANIFQNDFAMDDYTFIVRWPLIKNLGNFPLFFTAQSQPPTEEGIYSPLKTFFHAINYRLWGLNPLGHHIVSIVVHLAATILVYFIILRIAKNAAVAFLSSLFFGLHPVHTEAITFMTASVDMIGVVFLFASFLFYIKLPENETKNKTGNYIASLFLAVLAIFTYELTISLPLLFLVYDFCFRKVRGGFKRIFFRLAPYFLIVFFYAALKFKIFHTIARGDYVYGSFYLTMLVMVKALPQYLLVSLWPIYLTPNHVIAKGIYSFAVDDFDKNAVLSQSLWDPQVLASLIFIGAIILLWARIHKREPLVSFCLGWFFVGLLPVSNIIPCTIFFGERYLYLSSFGFCLALAYFLFLLYERKNLLFRWNTRSLSLCVIILVVAFYTMRTVIRNQDWRDDLTIHKARVESCPQSALMRVQLGTAYVNDGQPLEAIDSFKQALVIRPEDPDTYFSMTDAYMQLDDKQEAIACLRKAIELKPDFAEAYFNLAMVHGLLGKRQEAEKNLQKSTEFYRQQNKGGEAEKAEQAFRDYFRPPGRVVSSLQGAISPEKLLP